MEEHRRLVEILSDPSRSAPNLTNVRKYLLTGGLLRCGGLLAGPEGVEHRCDKPLSSQPSPTGKPGHACRPSAPSYGCGRVRISAEGLDELVRDKVLARLGSAKVRQRLAAAKRLNVDGLKAEERELDKREVAAGIEYARRQISLTVLKAVQEEVARHRKEIKESLAQAERVASLPAETPEALAEFWVDASLDRRRELVQIVLDHVVVLKAPRRGRLPIDPARLELHRKTGVE
jgi:hypothetical protein